MDWEKGGGAETFPLSPPRKNTQIQNTESDMGRFSTNDRTVTWPCDIEQSRPPPWFDGD